MKKLIMIAVVLLSVSAIIAQKSSNNNARKEVEKYLDENVVPELILQQQQFLMYLTKEEKAKVDEIKDQMTQMHKKQGGKNGNGQGRKSGKQHGKKGNGSDERGQEMRNRFEAVKEELTQISDAHPKAVDNYQQFIESNKDQWISDLDDILDENGVSRENAKQENAGSHGKLIDRLSDPVWLMLWNPEDPIMRKGMSHHMEHRNGGEFNEELRTEIRNYIDKNVFPIIAVEREAFDQNLDQDEKELISSVRAERGNHKRGEGKPKDIDREEMKVKMNSLHKIAENHQLEIQSSMDNYQQNTDVWKKDIQDIVAKYQKNDDPKRSQKMVEGEMFRRFDHPIGFLLFDPNQNFDKSDFDYLRKDDNFSLSIFPNPANANATIEINNANSMALSVALYSKEGEKINTLYSGLNENRVLSISFETSNLENGIYFVKAWSDERKLTEKLIVSH